MLAFFLISQIALHLVNHNLVAELSPYFFGG